MIKIGQKVKDIIKEKKNIKAWLLLSTAFAFMLSVFAPIEAYYSNKNEFWFSIWQLSGIVLIVFIIMVIALITIAYFLCNTRLSVYCYTFLTLLMVYLYIQGNYIPRNYGVLNGADIDWNQYAKYGVASIVLALICLVLGGGVILRLKKYAFKLGSYLSIFVFAIQIVTILTFAVQDIMDSSDKSKESKIVTDNKMFNLSENNNIIVFILDTFDGEYLNYLLDTDYTTYSEILKDFTYYKDTLGAYPTTKGALPQILTGVWYENERPYADYVENAYMKNSIYNSIEKSDYSLGIYTSGTYLSSDNDKYENVASESNGVYSDSSYAGRNAIDCIGQGSYRFVLYRKQ